MPPLCFLSLFFFPHFLLLLLCYHFTDELSFLCLHISSFVSSHVPIIVFVSYFFILPLLHVSFVLSTPLSFSFIFFLPRSFILCCFISCSFSNFSVVPSYSATCVSIVLSFLCPYPTFSLVIALFFLLFLPSTSHFSLLFFIPLSLLSFISPFYHILLLSFPFSPLSLLFTMVFVLLSLRVIFACRSLIIFLFSFNFFLSLPCYFIPFLHCLVPCSHSLTFSPSFISSFLFPLPCSSAPSPLHLTFLPVSASSFHPFLHFSV